MRLYTANCYKASDQGVKYSFNVNKLRCNYKSVLYFICKPIQSFVLFTTYFLYMMGHVIAIGMLILFILHLPVYIFEFVSFRSYVIKIRGKFCWKLYVNN